MVQGQNEGPSAPAARHPSTTAASESRCAIPGLTVLIPAIRAAAVMRAFLRRTSTSASDFTHRMAVMAGLADSMRAVGKASVTAACQRAFGPATGRNPGGFPVDSGRREASTYNVVTPSPIRMWT
jgi:hypothetical protein